MESSQPNARKVPSETEAPPHAEQRLQAIGSMLDNLEEAQSTPRAQAARPHENHLAQVRLGVATGLFTALQAKHPASAAHSLRVAMGCSAWSLALDLSDAERDELEAAALLHDVGKIGVPDYVLQKPARLEPEELELMQRHRDHGVRILASCAASSSLLDIVRFAPSWFNEQGEDGNALGEQLPLGARILSIVDAFDSMTSDHVWRRALSRERAMAELFQNAGSQFDPELVRSYCELQLGDQSRLQARVARRWLQQLQPAESNALWQLNEDISATSIAGTQGSSPYHQMLVENMHDAVMFVDSSMKITFWNHGAERLTGLAPDAVIGRIWLPRLIEMLNDRGLVIPDNECPVAQAISNGVQLVRRHTITGRGGKETQVNVHIIPVLSAKGVKQGATVLLHDMSSETTLEEQIQSLNARATQDALTKVANRAELDRAMVRFIDSHLQRNLPCSLILADIDHFKKINDTYGHQAGDDALITFASLLKRSCRTGDVVARYGGEEFAMLCADCDNAAATARAEKMRREIAAVTHDSLGGTTFTASFGVTEIQSGDSPETMIRRADRALYEAKEMGRNMVVQLGSGLSGVEEEKPQSWWQSWFGSGNVGQLLETRLIANVPIKIIAEKLRGFVADQEAEINSADEAHVVLTIDGPGVPMMRRTSDRSVPLSVELRFEERTSGGSVQTIINVVIRPKRGRDRRKSDSVERARQVLGSLKSYLIAQDYSDAAPESSHEAPAATPEQVVDKARLLLGPWLDSAGKNRQRSRLLDDSRSRLSHQNPRSE